MASLSPSLHDSSSSGETARRGVTGGMGCDVREDLLTLGMLLQEMWCIEQTAMYVVVRCVQVICVEVREGGSELSK